MCDKWFQPKFHCTIFSAISILRIQSSFCQLMLAEATEVSYFDSAHAREIWGSCENDYEYYCLLECDSMQSVRCVPNCKRKLQSSSLGDVYLMTKAVDSSKTYSPFLCCKGPKLQYSGLVPVNHTPWHYGRGKGYSNSESRDLIQYHATISCINKYCRNCKRSVPKFTTLINLTA